MIRHIGDNEFENEVLNSKGVCLVDFYASWCGPCMMLAPILEEVASSRAGFNIMKIDVDKNQTIASELNIDTIPTICIYKDGKLMERQVGYKNKDEIVDMMSKYTD